jgi:hypothetical protein
MDFHQYTFQVPAPPAAGPSFAFELLAFDENDAIKKARELIDEQTDEDGRLHVDLTFGLSGGTLKIEQADISAASIIEVRDNPEPF